MSTDIDRKKDLQLVSQVDVLNEEVKVLALNLAIYLAKAKEGNRRIHQMEPDFIRLVNGTVKVVQELALIINAARNRQQTVPRVRLDRLQTDQVEIKLRSILDQCGKIMAALSTTGDFSSKRSPAP